LDAIDTATPEGYRDYTIIPHLTGHRAPVSELTGLRLEDLWLEERILKVKGKGNRERPIPIGRRVRRLLWGYLNRFRPEPVVPTGAPVFLTADGRRLTARRIQAMMAKYGRKPGIRGVRCSPHTLRHCAAVRFLRNGGDAFSLQRLLGHRSLAFHQPPGEGPPAAQRVLQVADILPTKFLPRGGTPHDSQAQTP